MIAMESGVERRVTQTVWHGIVSLIQLSMCEDCFHPLPSSYVKKNFTSNLLVRVLILSVKYATVFGEHHNCRDTLEVFGAPLV